MRDVAQALASPCSSRCGTRPQYQVMVPRPATSQLTGSAHPRQLVGVDLSRAPVTAGYQARPPTLSRVRNLKGDVKSTSRCEGRSH